GVHFAEMAEHVLRPDLDRAAAPRVEPSGSAGNHLQRLQRRAGCGERGEGVALSVEHIDRAVAVRPMPPDAGGARQRAAHAGRGGELVDRLVALENLTDLEQSDI